MSLRILHLATPPTTSPFLSAHAANVAWLVPALRARGHDVTLRLVERPAAAAAAADAEGFDVIHIHDAVGDSVPKGRGVTPLVVTAYSPEGVVADLPWIALSHRSAERAANPPAAVIAPALDTAAMPAGPEGGDGLFLALSGDDPYALSAAIAVARAAERPLTILAPDPGALGEDAGIRIERASRYVRLVPAHTSWTADDLAGAGSCLSFGRSPFDMTALTAMAAGLPVLTFEGFPASEVIVHGESGYIVGSSEEAARVLSRLDVLRPELGRSRARVLFDAESAALRHEALYDQLAGGRRPVFRHPEIGPESEHRATPSPTAVPVPGRA